METPVPVLSLLVIGKTTVNVGQLATQLVPGQVTTFNDIPVYLDGSADSIMVDDTRTIPLTLGIPASKD